MTQIFKEDKVIPVTFDKVHLYAKYDDGELLKSEGIIDTAYHKHNRIIKTYLQPKAVANKDALAAIKQADYIIIGPGDLYTTIIPNLLVEGIARAIKQSTAQIIYIVNLFTKHGQTTKYTASGHIADIEKYISKKIDYVLINNRKIPPKILKFYQHHHEEEVADDLSKDKNVFRLDLIADNVYHKLKGDNIFRSILRHDPDKVAKVIGKIIG